MASSGAPFPHPSCLNSKLKLMPVSLDTGVTVLDGAGETLMMEWQNATCLQQRVLSQQCFSGLGHPGPRGSAWMWGAPLLCICHLPCQLGFCMCLLLPPAPKAASSASSIVDLWCGPFWAALSILARRDATL